MEPTTTTTTEPPAHNGDGRDLRPDRPAPDSAARRAARARRARRLKRAAWLLGGLLLVAGLAWAWVPKPIPVDAATVARGALTVTVDEDGRARVKDRYVVLAPLGGSLSRIELEPGDPVAAGQVVARILPAASPLLDPRSRAEAEARLAAAQAGLRQARAQVERGEANLEAAVQELTRFRALYREGALAKQQLDQAEINQRRASSELDSLRFAARVAAYQVETARAALERLRPGADAAAFKVTAPIDGLVLKVMRESEGVVQPGAQLLELGDPAALEVVVDVLTSDAVRIRPGAAVRLDGWGGPPLEGRVERVEPSAFTRLSSLGVEEQRVNVVIELVGPREPRQRLGDHFRVDAHIVVWQGKDVLAVPASAVFRQDGGWALFRVDGRGRARLTPVQIGERTGEKVQLLSGVSAGDRVITHPSDRIADGTRVAVR